MEQRNLFIAIVLSVGILIAFSYLTQRFEPAPPPLGHHAATAPAKTPAPSPAAAAASSGPAPTTQSAPPAAAAAPTRAVAPRNSVIAEEPRVKIDTPRLHGSIDLIGGRLNDLTLATYRETVAPKSPEVVLLSPSGTAEPYLAEFGWVAETKGVKVPGPETRWSAPGGRLTPTHPVTLSWDNGAGLLFTRTFSVDRDYMFTVKDAVENKTGAAVRLMPYGLVSRTGTPPTSGYYLLYEGPIGYLDGALKDVKYSSLKTGEPTTYETRGGWLGFTDKYWLTALIPPQSEGLKARFVHSEEHGVVRYQADYLGAAITVAPGGNGAIATRFFAGAKELNLLESYAAAGIPLFDYSIDFGWFWFLTKPIFKILLVLEGFLGNFGLAILLFTLMVKLLFFPLANKSYGAMSKMKLLQPEIQKIRERFPDDKARQQQETMALYKKVGANPLAGCLPIVIQIPVFFSLYKVLFVTIEMRHAPFFGWIHDLSAPDPTSFVNLFGLLPIVPPHVLMIGAWPLIMGVTMFLQQKLNPQPVDPTQAKMFMILPVVFTYMLASFPAGLVIYWAWNNTLSVAQQWVIMHRQGAA
jgi:YidC/Oxa1 family membrane protein insertase